tara:strand:- start:1133 stop:1375 length:243 start_codon:yes stop_codon:yes gene_type:complete
MEEEEKECPDYIGHAVRIIILGWALSVMTLGYMEKIRLDTFAAGLVGNIASSYGVSVKGKNGNNKKSVIVDNKNNNVGIK